MLTSPPVIPYQEPVAKSDSPELSSTLSSTLPMAAIFMRNKFIGWYAETFVWYTMVVPVH